MVTQPLLNNPGVNVVLTKLLNEVGYNSCQLIRWFQGRLQKLGGFSKFTPQQLLGTCRNFIANQDLDANKYLVLGTTSVLDLWEGGTIYDITPIDSTHNVTTPFSTTDTSTTVNVNVVGHGETVGNAINVATYTSIGGIILHGQYIIQSIVDADNFTITAATSATSTVSGGGTVSLFTTVNTQSTVTVTLDNHGFMVGDTYTIYVSTVVGGLTLFGQYSVESVVDADNFTITANTGAGSDDTGSENGGDVRLLFLLPAGSTDSGTTSGYGIGGYGYGTYGYGAPGNIPNPARQWFYAPWGGSMIAAPSEGSMYYWDSTAGLVANPATVIATAPSINTAIFIAMPQQQVVSLGAEVGGIQDPLLLRWCDVADYTDWIATTTNQAGSFRIPSGSRIVGGIQAPQQGLIWTDTSLWAMQYIQPPFVYGFNKLGDGYGLIGGRAMGVLGHRVFWMGQDGFFVYDGGGISVVPCSVWDFIFQNLDETQLEKITCAPNSSFNEIAWYFPSESGDGEVDMYVKYNAVENLWDYGILVRTAWIDQSIFGQPMGIDDNSYIQQHEISNDADGVAMVSYAETGFFKIANGHEFVFIERMIPDFVLSAGATAEITINACNYPNDIPDSTGVIPFTSSGNYAIIRKRNRLISVKIGSSDLGSFWRLGEILFWIAQAGKR